MLRRMPQLYGTFGVVRNSNLLEYAAFRPQNRLLKAHCPLQNGHFLVSGRHCCRGVFVGTSLWVDRLLQGKSSCGALKRARYVAFSSFPSRLP